MRISLCNEVVADLAFAEQAKLAAALGYDGLEVAPFTLDAEAPHLLPAAKRAELRRIAREEGAPITSLHWLLVAPAGLSITSADAALRQRTLDVMQRLIGLAADLGATLLVHGSPKQRHVAADGDAGRAEEAMAKAGAWAAEHGLTYCLEPLDAGQTNWARTVAEAVEIVSRLNVPGLKTMLDVSAAGNGEQETAAALLRRFIPGGWIAHVHLNDRNRRGPGQGGDEFRPVCDALRDTRYDGFCAVEPFDYHPNGAASAARAIGYLRGILEA
ncbi:sugar phosphate isomerase/epimerase family protein [Roseomonas sp. F4]